MKHCPKMFPFTLLLFHTFCRNSDEMSESVSGSWLLHMYTVYMRKIPLSENTHPSRYTCVCLFVLHCLLHTLCYEFVNLWCEFRKSQSICVFLLDNYSFKIEIVKYFPIFFFLRTFEMKS